MQGGFANSRALLQQKIFVAKDVYFALCKRPALSVLSPLKVTLSPLMGLRGPAHLMECVCPSPMNDGGADKADKMRSCLSTRS